MAETGLTTRFALPLFVVFAALGGVALACAAGRLAFLNHGWMAHVGVLFVLVAGTMLMWHAEHHDRS